MVSCGLMVGLFGLLNVVHADSPQIRYPENGHYYQRIDAPKTWISAKAYCESLGGYLATITLRDEDVFVYGQLGLEGVNIWLGGTDRNLEGLWLWVTGEPWSSRMISLPEGDSWIESGIQFGVIRMNLS